MRFWRIGNEDYDHPDTRIDWIKYRSMGVCAVDTSGYMACSDRYITGNYYAVCARLEFNTMTRSAIILLSLIAIVCSLIKLLS
mgnify:CR=1 FL=1